MPDENTEAVEPRKTPTVKVRVTKAAGDEVDPDPATLPPAAPRVALNAPFTPPGTTVAPSSALIQREVNERYTRESRELADVISGLEIGHGKTTLQLHRSQPMVFKGKRVGGFLREFTTQPTLEELKGEFGGGTYFWRVMRAGPNGSRPFGPTTTPFDFPGDPIIPEGAETTVAAKTGTDPALQSIIEKTLDKADRQAERAEERAEKALAETRTLMLKRDESGGGLQSALLSALNPADRIQMAQLEATERRLEREAAEKVRREERDVAEKRAIAEAAERDRRWAAEREQAQRNHELQMKTLEAEATRVRLEAKEKADRDERMFQERKAQDQRNYDLQVQAMKDNTAMQLAAMKESTATQIAAFQQLDKMKDSFYERQLSQKPPDILDQLVKYKEIGRIFSGKDDEEEEPMWRQVLTEVKEMGREIGPSLLASAGIAGLGGKVKNADERGSGNREQRRRRRRQVEPGTVVVVDDDDAPKQVAPAPKPKVRASPPPAPGAPARAEPENESVEDEEITHGLKGITLPTAEMINNNDNDAIFELLIRNLEWALENDNTPSWIVNNIIKKFPEGLATLLKTATVDQAIAVIEDKVLPTWHLASPDGLNKMRQAHAILIGGK